MVYRPLPHLAACALSALALAACEGRVSDLGGGDTATPPRVRKADSLCTATPAPGTAPIRRLSNEEWKYTVGDLLGPQAALATQLSATFTPETASLGFRNDALFLDVQAVMAQEYMDASGSIAAAATADLTK